MTDHDRGAYTPQPDAPLQFDARGPRGRKPMPMTLIGSGAVLVVLLGALALHYRHDNKGGAEGPRPVGEPVTQVKAAAPSTAQPKDAAGGAIDVFGGKTDDAKAPVLAPPPEAPKPRPQLTVQAMDTPTAKATPVTTTATSSPATSVAASTPPPVKAAAPATTVAKIAPAKIAPTKPAPIYVAPVAPAKADATSIIDKVAAMPPAKPAGVAKLATATVKPAAASAAGATTTAPAKAAAAGGSVVQIGAFSSSALSDKGFADVSAAMAGAMGGKSKRVEALEKDGKTLYRTSVVGFPNRAAAEAFCKALAAKGHTCFAKG